MSFNVTDFKSIAGSLQRSYQFRIIFPALGIGLDLGSNDMKNATVLVKSSKCPSKNIAAIDVPYAANQLKLPGNVTYPDWTCTFRVDTKLGVYNAMYQWSEQVRSSDTNILSAPATYKKEVTLQQLNGENPSGEEAVGEYTLLGAWPITIGEINLDTTTSDVQEFQVTFAYDSFHFQTL